MFVWIVFLFLASVSAVASDIGCFWEFSMVCGLQKWRRLQASQKLLSNRLGSGNALWKSPWLTHLFKFRNPKYDLALTYRRSIDLLPKSSEYFPSNSILLGIFICKSSPGKSIFHSYHRLENTWVFWKDCIFSIFTFGVYLNQQENWDWDFS